MHTKSHICHCGFNGMGVDSHCVERVVHSGVPRTMESFFSKKVEELEGIGGLLNQPFTLTTMTLVVTLRDYCKNIKKNM